MTKKQIVIALTLVAAGCIHQGAKRVTPYKPEELYQGYPCAPNCAEFKQGFDHAQEQDFKTIDRCPEGTNPQAVGCQAYLKEYQIENKSYQELINDL